MLAYLKLFFLATIYGLLGIPFFIFDVVQAYLPHNEVCGIGYKCLLILRSFWILVTDSICNYNFYCSRTTMTLRWYVKTTSRMYTSYFVVEYPIVSVSCKLSLSMDPLSICTTRINDTARLVCKFNFIVIFVILL